MPNILVAVDGSENSDRVVDFLIKRCGWYKEPAQVHLLNVQLPLVGVNVKMFISQDTVNEYYRDEGNAALKRARERLDAAGIQYTHHISVGDPAQMIVEFAQSKGCDHILMGSRGLGAVSGLVLGSVATKVLHLTDLPVMLVR
ncbi:MAG: universal stress protein [Betaproteobacteria bacterium]|nr:universal stress protein [Betaproteobacteria bacterium]